MSLTEQLKTTIIKDIKNIDILFINFYATQNSQTLKDLIKIGIINHSEIEKAIEFPVFNQARKDYN